MLWMRVRNPLYSVFAVIYTLVTHGRLVSQAEIDTYLICRSYCMVCAYVREDNPRALARGLSPVQMHNHTKLAYCISMPIHFVHCEAMEYQ